MPIVTEAFPTLAQARAFLRLRDQDTKGDGLLTDLINAVAQYFENMTGRRLKRRDYTNVVVNGTGWTNLFLPEYPVTAISSIKADMLREFDAAAALIVFDGTGTQDTHDVVIVDDGISGEIALVNGDVWPDGPGTVLVSYTAGYDPAAQTDLTQAQLIAIEELWNLAGRDPSITSFSMGGVNQALGNSASSARVEASIAAWKRASFE